MNDNAAPAADPIHRKATMAISLSSARRLCTAPELELVESSRASHLKQLTPARIRQKITRARRLRDKYRDLAKRQRLEARGKSAPRRSRPAQGQENTQRKAQLFQEVLERFEAGLPRVEAAAAKKAPGAKAAGPKKAAGAAGAKKATGAAGAKKAGDPKKATGAGQLEAKPPARAGAAAMKGARQRPAKRGPQDASQQARGKVARAHTRSSNRRTQQRRDSGR
jgi:hypothetical protein